jgi:hypothetical protein
MLRLNSEPSCLKKFNIKNRVKSKVKELFNQKKYIKFTKAKSSRTLAVNSLNSISGKSKRVCGERL